MSEPLDPRHAPEGAGPTGPYSARSADGDISLLRLVNAMLAHRRLLLFLPLGAALVVLLASLLLPRTYVASASFAPQQEDTGLRRLSSLASRFGFELPSPPSTESPAFYAELLESRRILEPVVLQEYALEGGGGEVRRATLVELSRGSAESDPEAVRKAVERLRRDVRVRKSSETGVVRYTVSARHPELAEQIAVHLLASLTRFNSESRQTRATAERAFVEARLRDTDRELVTKEEQLETFLRENRRYDNSPELMFQYERLHREVDLQRQLHSSLSEAYEQARIEEVRNTPVLTVVDDPEGSVRPRSLYLGLRLLLAALIAFLVALCIAAAREFSSSRAVPDVDELERFRVLQADARGELARIWRGFRRPTRSVVAREDRRP